MNTQTALNKQAAAISALDDTYGCLKSFRESHAWMCERKNTRVYAPLAGCPRWVKEYVRGYDRALFQRVYDELVFGAWIEGEFYSTHDGRADEVTARGMTYREYGELLEQTGTEPHHYWKSDVSRQY